MLQAPIYQRWQLSPVLVIVNNLHACLCIPPSVLFLAVFLVFAHHLIYKNVRLNGNTQGTVRR